MPKLSVSIPDDLWEQAMRLAGAGKGPSQVIQDALRREVGERQAVRANLLGSEAVVAPERFQAVIESVREDAREAFTSGYERGLEWAEEEGYAGLRYARLMDWVAGEVLGFGDPPESWERTDYQEDLEDDSNEIFRDGFARALQDCWRAIRGGLAADDTEESDAPPGGQATES